MSSSKGKQFTWEELGKHNVRTDCWLAVRGKVYDVTSWIEKHPGGEDTIVLNGVSRLSLPLFIEFASSACY